MLLQEWPHQRAARQLILSIVPRTQRGVILGFKTGGGKTLTAMLASVPRNGYALIVVPKTMVLKWVDEYEKFGLPVRPIPVTGTIPRRMQIIQAFGHRGNVLVTNYATLQHIAKRQAERKRLVNRNGKLVETKYYVWTDYLLRVQPPEVIVVDEAHIMNNPESLITQSITNIPAQRRLLLTATPVDDKPSQYYPLLAYIDPDLFLRLFPYKSHFIERFEIRKRGLYDPFKFVGPKNTDVLQAMLKGEHPDTRGRRWLISWSDNTGLPPLIEEVTRLEMEPKQAKHYRDIERMNITRDTDGRLVWVEGGASYVRLKQVATVPSAIKQVSGDKVNLPVVSSKFDHVLERLADPGRSSPIAVYSQFIEPLNDLEKILAKAGYRVRRITGKENDRQRKQAYTDINAGNADVVLLTDAGGEGIELVGANRIMMLNVPTTRRAAHQIISRLHRPGAEHHSTVYAEWLLSEGTVDMAGYRTLLAKGVANAELVIDTMNDEEIARYS
jgi:superfamily II DNA or RNA helicase